MPDALSTLTTCPLQQTLIAFTTSTYTYDLPQLSCMYMTLEQLWPTGRPLLITNNVYVGYI